MPRKSAMFWKVRATPRSATLAGLELRDVGALERDPAGVGVVEPADHVEQRGLARPVGPDDGEDLALAHVEAHAVDRLHAAEGLGDLADLELRAHGGPSRQPPLPAPVVLDVAIALALPHAGQPQVELLDVLVLADGPRGRRRAPPGRSPSRSTYWATRSAMLAFCSASSTATCSSRLSRLTISKISCTSIGREAHRGLVEQHQPRVGHERAPDREHLLLAARDVAGPAPSAAPAAGESTRTPARGPAEPRPSAACSRRPAGSPPPSGARRRGALHHLHHAPLTTSAGSRRWIGSPRSSTPPLVTSPRSVRSSPEMALSVVLLPAPVGPEEGDDAPLGNLRATRPSTRGSRDRRSPRCC